MFNILLNTLIDAAPMLLTISVFYVFVKAVLWVGMAPVSQKTGLAQFIWNTLANLFGTRTTYGQPYAVAIGAHKKRLSALE